jgi:hypothetical protein
LTTPLFRLATLMFPVLLTDSWPASGRDGDRAALPEYQPPFGRDHPALAVGIEMACARQQVASLVVADLVEAGAVEGEIERCSGGLETALG